MRYELQQVMMMHMWCWVMRYELQQVITMHVWQWVMRYEQQQVIMMHVWQWVMRYEQQQLMMIQNVAVMSYDKRANKMMYQRCDGESWLMMIRTTCRKSVDISVVLLIIEGHDDWPQKVNLQEVTQIRAWTYWSSWGCVKSAVSYADTAWTYWSSWECLQQRGYELRISAVCESRRSVQLWSHEPVRASHERLL